MDDGAEPWWLKPQPENTKATMWLARELVQRWYAQHKAPFIEMRDVAIRKEMTLAKQAIATGASTWSEKEVRYGIKIRYDVSDRTISYIMSSTANKP
jgi:hypothetical protein